MKRIFPLLTLLTLSLIPLANECWLQPDKFIYKWNETINIRFFTGENFEGKTWTNGSKGDASLSIYFDGVKDDMTDELTDENNDSFQLKLLDEGTALVVFNSSNAFSEMEPAEFNAYLQKQGFLEILAYRKQNNKLDSTAHLYHQQSAKTLFQVGKKYTNTFKQEISLPLDIIPLQNPYNLKKNDSLDVKILLQYKPLANHLILVWNKIYFKTSVTSMRTDTMGIIKIPVATQGCWMVSTVILEKKQEDKNADATATTWQSFRGSLTWGYQ